ncbi:DNA-processing protein DprA [Ornithinimicrobium pekingense]|uniref:DNA processing protein DprA n=1 Tax=Ornithinimicrobium pekingense TaxID=384677 RepID=A0ABQ2F4Z8_9MICO|nr:DNA-processing protein DprA [Ornithinimicrobium pekingense]GGK62523.1 putative DNA processing protein DprA [Ornithinimicrobium pekingense]
MRPPAALLGERDARLLLARIAEPYDDKVQELVAAHGVVDLVGYAVRDGRTPDGASLERLRARLPRAQGVDDAQICRALGLTVLVPGDEGWPSSLDHLPDPPWCLWVRGPVPPQEWCGRAVAMVGARASTAYGDEVAARMSYELAERGFAVVSGAAYGIDAAAHRGALRAGGTTVAVLAGGVDVPYPRANTDLLASIAGRGAVVSETPPGGAPARMRFLARNRIIAALGDGTVVVEANVRSGARTTAKVARELGRHLMAVPGPVSSVMSSGCHEEIRLGATLVTDAAEVAELVGRIGEDLAPVRRGEVRDEDALPAETRRVWQWLRPRRSASVDELMVRSGLALGEVLVALSELEERGMAEQLLDGWKRRSVR